MGLQAFRGAPDLKTAEKQLDLIVQENKELDKSRSKLDVRDWPSNLAYAGVYDFMTRWVKMKKEQLPDYGDPSRDFFLSKLWKEEPIMAGAVYSMVAKMEALKWSVTGRRRKAKEYATIFASAAHMGGYDWGGFIGSTMVDFYTTNRGVFWETPRNGSDPIIGELAGIGHIDSILCTLTGNKNTPMIYASDTTGQILNFRPGEYIHFASLPSPREMDLGIGFCAVDRALRAITLLIGLHDYDDEKLANLPPEGVAAVTGLTMNEFQDALTMWQAKRESDRSLTFPQVLWLIGSQPNVEVKVALQGFSQMPESFTRDIIVPQYVATLALCFGVDAREFWPVSSGALGTASESEIQHLKAKGKGHGEGISGIERQLNGEMPEDTQFAFDTQDIEEDQNAAVVAKAWIDAYYPLYTGTPAGKTKASPGGKPNTEMVPDKDEITEESASGNAMRETGPLGAPPGPEQVITKDELRRLLADHGVIPEWMMNDQRYMVTDTQIHIGKGDEGDYDDVAKYEFHKGVLKEVRPDPIVLWTKPEPKEQLTFASKLESNGHKKFQEALLYMQNKEEQIMADKRNIRGDPIPDREVARGNRVTQATIRTEIERWKKNPLLAPYVEFTQDELEKLYEAVS
jgi:hypothetical protein